MLFLFAIARPKEHAGRGLSPTPVHQEYTRYFFVCLHSQHTPAGCAGQTSVLSSVVLLLLNVDHLYDRFDLNKHLPSITSYTPQDLDFLCCPPPLRRTHRTRYRKIHNKRRLLCHSPSVDVGCCHGLHTTIFHRELIRFFPKYWP